MSLWGTIRLKLPSMRRSSARDTRGWNQARKARLDILALSRPSLMLRAAQLSTSTGHAGDSCRHTHAGHAHHVSTVERPAAVYQQACWLQHAGGCRMLAQRVRRSRTEVQGSLQTHAPYCSGHDLCWYCGSAAVSKTAAPAVALMHAAGCCCSACRPVLPTMSMQACGWKCCRKRPMLM